jgi:hypothetical protein
MNDQLINEIDVENVDERQKSRLLRYYLSNIAINEENIRKLSIRLEYLKTSFEMWQAYLEPNINILKIDPLPRKDKNGLKPKPYYRAISSFPYKGKKKQIMAYVGTVDDYKAGIDNKRLEQKAILLIRRNILKKYPLALFFEDLKNGRDSFYDKEYSGSAFHILNNDPVIREARNKSKK